MLERIPAENLSCPGQYPVFLWLFKDIMEEVREQLQFHDHLVAAVTDWKNQIIAELKSDKNIIFIGVHCRNDSNQTILLHKSDLTFSFNCFHFLGERIT